MTPEDFTKACAKIIASENTPLVLQESTTLIPPWLMKDGETPEQALARVTAEAEAEGGGT